MVSRETGWTHFFLISTALLAFFQVATGMHPMKYDAMDCFLPWRFSVSESLQAGHLPLWNPYQDYGYPMQADPSSGAWYPLVWIFGKICGYSVYTISAEFMLYVYLAGWGMVYLCRQLGISQWGSLIAGIGFMAGGMFVGNAQHMPYAAGACWLPWFLGSYFRALLPGGKGMHALQAGFFLFLLVSGGYPAFTVIVAYLLVLFSVYFGFKSLLAKNWIELKRRILASFLICLSCLIFSAGMLYSIYEVGPFLHRLGDFSLAQAQFSPFTFPSFISFIFPLATSLKDEVWFGSDLAMRNGYFGLLPLVFFLLALPRKKSGILWIFLAFGLFSLAASTGPALPLRAWLFHHLPGMNIFRFPSVFRLFFILSALILAGWFMDKHMERSKRPIGVALVLAAIGIIITLLIFRSSGYLSVGAYLRESLFSPDAPKNLGQAIGVQGIIQLFFLCLILLSFKRIHSKRKLLLALTGTCTADLVVSAQLNGPYTVYFPQVTAKEAHKNLSVYPTGFPLPANISFSEAAARPSPGLPFWINLATFQKVLSPDGYNSFTFSGLEKLESDFPGLFWAMRENKPVALSAEIYPESELKFFETHSKFSSSQVFLRESDWESISALSMSHHTDDTAEMVSFGALHSRIRVSVRDAQILTYFQRYYTGWEVWLDGERLPILVSNLNFMSVLVPAGSHEVEFRYRNASLEGGFYFTGGALFTYLLLLIGRLIYKWRRQRSQERLQQVLTGSWIQRPSGEENQ